MSSHLVGVVKQQKVGRGHLTDLKFQFYLLVGSSHDRDIPRMCMETDRIYLRCEFVQKLALERSSDTQRISLQ